MIRTTAVILALTGFCAGCTPLAIDGINFGDDSSQWAKDGECDDPRFVGEGMTSTPLLAQDIKADASDCAAAYRAGKLKFNN